MMPVKYGDRSPPSTSTIASSSSANPSRIRPDCDQRAPLDVDRERSEIAIAVAPGQLDRDLGGVDGVLELPRERRDARVDRRDPSARDVVLSQRLGVTVRAHQVAGADRRLVTQEVLDRDASGGLGRAPIVTRGLEPCVRAVAVADRLVEPGDPPRRVGEAEEVPRPVSSEGSAVEYASCASAHRCASSARGRGRASLHGEEA